MTQTEKLQQAVEAIEAQARQAENAALAAAYEGGTGWTSRIRATALREAAALVREVLV